MAHTARRSFSCGQNLAPMSNSVNEPRRSGLSVMDGQQIKHVRCMLFFDR
jgi:hypothetical protein